MRLLEVVAEDLLVLDDVVARLHLEPAGEALVCVGSELLGRGFVGGLLDEGVPEAEAVVAWELRTIGANQLLTDE